MGSALETLCGQAVGAGQPRMLGVYLQRSWVICLATSLALLPLYLLASPALRLLRQSAAISSVAGRYARWCAPQLFAYAVNFPMQKFYQAQSRVWAVTAISAAALAAHALLNWLVVARLGHGVVGAALVGDVSWWLLNAAQFAYLVGGSFPEAWSGFSRKAFTSLGGFVKLSLSSAVMLWFVALYMQFKFHFTVKISKIFFSWMNWCLKLGDVVLHSSADSGGLPEEPRDSSWCDFNMVSTSISNVLIFLYLATIEH
jgi:Na+-driven multidrug efflux pump